MKRIFTIITTLTLLGFMFITPAFAIVGSLSYVGPGEYIDCSVDEAGTYYYGYYDSITEDLYSWGATELLTPGFKQDCFGLAGATPDANYYGVFTTTATLAGTTFQEAQAQPGTMGTTSFTLVSEIISSFVYTQAAVAVPILTVPVGGASDALAYVGQLFTDVWVLVAVAIGVPLGFYVIKRSINLVKK